MKTAFYHQHGIPPKAFRVLKEHGKGVSVDLGGEDGVVIISNCPVSKEAVPGHATIGASLDNLAALAGKMRASAEKLRKKADEAKAASAAKPDDVTLAKASEAAETAAAQAEADADAAEASLKDS